jgi:hypothetical protein
MLGSTRNAELCNSAAVLEALCVSWLLLIALSNLVDGVESSSVAILAPLGALRTAVFEEDVSR